MKERGGKSLLVSGQEYSMWAWWLLGDRGWTEETSPTTAGAVWWVKNMSGPGPLLESSEWLSVSERSDVRTVGQHSSNMFCDRDETYISSILRYKQNLTD